MKTPAEYPEILKYMYWKLLNCWMFASRDSLKTVDLVLFIILWDEDNEIIGNY